MTMKKISVFLTLFICIILFFGGFSYAQESPVATPTPTPSSNLSTISECANQQLTKEQCVTYLQKKASELSSQANTLSSQIAVMNNQINLTEARIESNRQQIADITLDIDTAEKRISKLDNSLDSLTVVLAKRIVATYQVGTVQPLQVLVTSSDATNFLSRLNYLRIAQAHDKKLMYDTVQAKNDYANQKDIFEAKKKKIEDLKAQLESYTAQLEKEKKTKQDFLISTKNDERIYQSLLTKARAEYAAIQGIIAGKGTEKEIGTVSEGQQIASIIPSASCNSSGPHLHFIVKDGGSQNPFSYLKSVDHSNESEGDPFNPLGDWNWPIDPPIQFNQGYGSETWYVRTYHRYPFHDGIDISGPSYTVKAVKAGTLFRGSYSGAGGCTLPYVRVKHNDSKETLYLHVYSAS